MIMRVPARGPPRAAPAGTVFEAGPGAGI